MKRPVAYLRKSRVTSDRHVSWELQEAEIHALAARHGDGDLDVLSDWGKSGRGDKTRLRSGYRQLRTMVETDEVSAIYAYSLSRLSRSLKEYSDLAELCRDHAVPIRLCKDGEFDYTTPNGRAMMGMVAVFAQMEVELAQERARDTIQARRARGDHVGSAGYGKRIWDGVLVDNPGEDIDEIVGAYREAGSFAGAARILNAADVRSKFGRKWSGTTVRRVIGTGAPSELAGRRIERRVAQRGSYTLSRLLRCPCGQIMTGRSGKGSGRYGEFGPYPSYQCYRGRYEPDHPRPYMVSERAVMPWIEAEAGRLRAPSEIAVELGDERTREGLEERRRRVLDNYEDGFLDKAQRDAKLDAVADEMEQIDSYEAVLAVPTIDWTWPPSQLNAVLRAILECVELGSDLRPVAAVWRVPEWRGDPLILGMM